MQFVVTMLGGGYRSWCGSVLPARGNAWNFGRQRSLVLWRATRPSDARALQHIVEQAIRRVGGRLRSYGATCRAGWVFEASKTEPTGTPPMQDAVFIANSRGLQPPRQALVQRPAPAGPRRHRHPLQPQYGERRQRWRSLERAIRRPQARARPLIESAKGRGSRTPAWPRQMSGRSSGLRAKVLGGDVNRRLGALGLLFCNRKDFGDPSNRKPRTADAGHGSGAALGAHQHHGIRWRPRYSVWNGESARMGALLQ
jgi:hypothetical protein